MARYPSNLICSLVVSTVTATVNRDDSTIIIEASTGQINGYSPLYNDAADVGLALESHRTHTRAYFYLDQSIRDSDNDLLFDILKPCEETVRMYPHLRDWTLLVYND